MQKKILFGVVAETNSYRYSGTVGPDSKKSFEVDFLDENGENLKRTVLIVDDDRIYFHGDIIVFNSYNEGAELSKVTKLENYLKSEPKKSIFTRLKDYLKEKRNKSIAYQSVKLLYDLETKCYNDLELITPEPIESPNGFIDPVTGVVLGQRPIDKQIRVVKGMESTLKDTSLFYIINEKSDLEKSNHTK